MATGTRAPRTIVTVNLQGQTDFNIPFEYLARKFVVVTLLGTDRKVLTLNTDYRFVGKTIISLANPTPAGYTQLELRRETSATERLVDYHDGSILRAYDLNLSQIQTLHVAEEARDLTADTIGVNDEGHLDARNRRIVNLADAVNGRDAVTLGQVIEWNDSAFNSAEAAATSANRAAIWGETSKNWGERSEAAGKKSETYANESKRHSDAALASQQDVTSKASDVTTKHADVVVKHSDIMGVVPKLDDAVQAMAGLGSVPIGTVCMVTAPKIPVGWLRCGEPFDVTLYPALARLYPSGVTPSFDGRYPRGRFADEGDKVGAGGTQTLATHTHGVPSQVVNTTGQTNPFDIGTKSVSIASGGTHSHPVSIPYAQVGSGPYVGNRVARASSADYLGEFPAVAAEAGAHTHSASVSVGSHSHSFSSKGSTVAGRTDSGDGTVGRTDPYHMNVWYIIKAYEGVEDKDAALQVIGAMEQKVVQLENTVSGLSNAIVESGSNANGYYVKLVDGTLICYLYGTINFPATTTYGPLHMSTGSWTYPTTFVSPPSVTIGMIRVTGRASWGLVAGATGTVATLRYMDVVAQGIADCAVTVQAIGRWK